MAVGSSRMLWVKRIDIGLGGFVGILIVAAVVLPFIINIDQYRPQIIGLANEHINGRLDIGKLSLSLWGQVEIDIAGVTLEDINGEKLVSVEDTYAQIS